MAFRRSRRGADGSSQDCQLAVGDHRAGGLAGRRAAGRLERYRERRIRRDAPDELRRNARAGSAGPRWISPSECGRSPDGISHSSSARGSVVRSAAGTTTRCVAAARRRRSAVGRRLPPSVASNGGARRRHDADIGRAPRRSRPRVQRRRCRRRARIRGCSKTTPLAPQRGAPIAASMRAQACGGGATGGTASARPPRRSSQNATSEASAGSCARRRSTSRRSSAPSTPSTYSAATRLPPSAGPMVSSVAHASRQARSFNRPRLIQLFIVPSGTLMRSARSS